MDGLFIYTIYPSGWQGKLEPVPVDSGQEVEYTSRQVNLEYAIDLINYPIKFYPIDLINYPTVERHAD